MIEDFMKCHDFLCSMTTKNRAIRDVFANYFFFNAIENTISTNECIQKIKESKLIIINECKEVINELTNQYLIIGFEKTLIIHKITKQSINFIQPILSIDSFIPVCYLSNSKTVINEIITIKNLEIEVDNNFYDEIYNFQKNIMGTKPKFKSEILPLVFQCILGYLIRKSYLKLPKHRISRFITDIEKEMTQKSNTQESICEDDYINLRYVGSGYSFMCILVYHITREELFVIKKPLSNDEEDQKLFIREINNYTKIRHQFLPKFYGTVIDKNYLVIVFINGKTLDDKKLMKLEYNDKIIIIFELMLVMSYLHNNELIYRDLKPNNIMIDENKAIVLIDFNRMVENNSKQESVDLANEFSAPEVKSNGIHSYKSDIYSLGMMIEYILKLSNDSFEAKDHVEKLINLCKDGTEKNHNFVTNLIQRFNSIFQSIKIENLSTSLNNHFISFYMINQTFKIPKMNQNLLEAQLNLGSIYYEGKYVSCDINKAIHYFTIAANQNQSEAQFNLAEIYFRGQYINRDITKAIHYYTLSANQNNSEAQFNLAEIYFRGQYIDRDITKAIHYYSLASNLNHSEAQFNLGEIFYDGKYNEQNISNAIHYYSMASDNNHPEAQYMLGLIYYEGKYINQDIKKSIHYYSLAGTLNHSEALYNLGVLYEKGRYIARDINKAIYCFQIASDLNNPKAQFYLSVIYSEKNIPMKFKQMNTYLNQDVKLDISKGIYYLQLAANNNFRKAQFYLGIFYYKGQYYASELF